MMLLLVTVATATEIYRAVLADGTIVFTSSPQHAGYELWTPDGFRPVPSVSAVSERTFPLLDTYDDRFVIAEERYGVPAELLKAICLAESGMNPNALSHKGAIGLMQLMPGTASDLGVTDPWDPWDNIDGGARYIRQMSDLFGDWRRTVAAYNAGPHNVTKHGGVPPFEETRQYVEKVLELYDFFQRIRPIDREAAFRAETTE